MAWAISNIKWHGVAAWTWDAGDDMCSICRTPFDGCPPDGKYPGDDSPVVWGVCGHAFHLQCITKWLQSQEQSEQRCPFCRRAWEFKSAVVEAPGEGGAGEEPEGAPGEAMEGQQQTGAPFPGYVTLRP